MILALDPGGNTGYALYDDDEITMGAFPTFTRLDELILQGQTVIVERPFATVRTDPIVFEVKGAIMERAYVRGCHLVWQEPSVPKFIWSRYEGFDKRLKGPIHAKDAFCHLVWYLTRTRPNKLTVEEVLSMLRSK